MPLPLSLRQPFRQGQIAVGAGWRAFAANFNQALAVAQSSTQYGPTIYDLLVSNRFNDASNTTGSSSLPTGWYDCGWISKFKISPGSKIGAVSSGYRNAVRALYRADVAEKCSFSFNEQSRTAWKIATGEGVFNLLKSSAAPSLVGPLSSSGIAAVPMGSGGYSASGNVTGYVGYPVVYATAGSGSLFPAGTYIVADQDYNGTSFGFVGDAGANVYSGAQPNDTDFIRKTSDYVATVLAVVTGQPGGDALVLNAPMVGGGNNPNVGVVPNTGPTSGAKIQAVTGFASRAGGTTINEFSMIFVMDTADNAQFLMYYPRLAPDQYSGLTEANLPNANSLQQNSMDTSMMALAYDDPLDGETVCSYRAYIPRVSPSIQIQN